MLVLCVIRNRTPPWQFKMGSIETGDCSRVVLVPGDVLYLPQGTIHHAEAVRENLSVHLSLTVGPPPPSAAQTSPVYPFFSICSPGFCHFVCLLRGTLGLYPIFENRAR